MDKSPLANIRSERNESVSGGSMVTPQQARPGQVFMRVKTAGSKNKSIVLDAAKHNGREIPTELGSKDHGSIDVNRSELNVRLHGPQTAKEVSALARQRMKEANCKIRSNAALMLEVVFSLTSNSGIDELAYFRECLSWAADTFGGWNNVLCADVHNDQTHPHLHVLMVPIKDGELAGSKMTGGGREGLKKLNIDLFERVASRYGLALGAPAPAGRPRGDIAADVFDRFAESNDPALRSPRWHRIRETIEANPYPLAVLMGVETGKPRKLRKSVEVFTSEGAGPSKESTPRSFKREDHQLLPCVGVSRKADVPQGHQTSPSGGVPPGDLAPLNEVAKRSEGRVGSVYGGACNNAQRQAVKVEATDRPSNKSSSDQAPVSPLGDDSLGVAGRCDSSAAFEHVDALVHELFEVLVNQTEMDRLAALGRARDSIRRMTPLPPRVPPTQVSVDRSLSFATT